MGNHRKQGRAMIRRGSFDASQAFQDAWETRGRATAANAEVRELVQAAELICRSAVAEPSVDFRMHLREQLMDEANDVLVAKPAELKPVRKPTVTAQPRRRRLAGLTAALVASVGIVGTVASSASAVPGDLLYPVKRGVENVQVVFHQSDAARGEFRLQQARERLAEAQALQNQNDSERLAATLDDFASQAESGTSDLFVAYESGRETQNIDAVNDFVAEASVTLASLSAEVPSDAQASFTSAAELVSGLASQASELCGTCSTADISSLIGGVESLLGSATTVEQPVVPTDTIDKPASVTAPADAPVPSAVTTQTPAKTSTGSDSGSGTSTGPGSSTGTGLGDVVTSTLDAVVGEDGLVGGLLGGLLGN